MLTPTERSQLHTALRSLNRHELLQLAQQLRLPITPHDVFEVNRERGTAGLKTRADIDRAVRRHVEELPNTMQNVRRAAYLLSLVGVAIYTLWKTVPHRAVFQQYATLWGTIAQLKAKLLKIKMWDKDANTHMYIRPASSSFSVSRALSSAAQNMLMDQLDIAGQKVMSGEMGVQLEIAGMTGAKDAFYKEHAATLRPGLFGVKALGMVLLLNAVVRSILPRKNYAAYARAAAYPDYDAHETYTGPYDGCLHNIDRALDALFTDAPKAMPRVLFALLSTPGDRRKLELHHLVRADGTLRTGPNEMAHAIAKSDTWTKYFSDRTHTLRLMLGPRTGSKSPRTQRRRSSTRQRTRRSR